MAPKASKARIAANGRYNAKTYDQFAFRSLKSKRLPELLEIAINQSNQSKNAFIESAVFEKLARYGITINGLPDANEDND